MKTIHQPAELYAHAIAIEREAGERYGEFAERMGDLGNDAAAEVFGRLAALEAEHLDALLRRTDGVALPKLSTDQYRWLDAEPPETAAHELVFRLFTPRQAFMNADDPSLAASRRRWRRKSRSMSGWSSGCWSAPPTRASTGKPRWKRRGAHRGPLHVQRLRRVSGR